MKYESIKSMSNEEKLTFYLLRAERGYPLCQYWASQHINAAEIYPNRSIEALKWLIIASILDPTSVPKDVVTYMQTHLTDAQRDETFILVQQWLEIKLANESEDESVWSIELSKYKYPNKDFREDASEAEISKWLMSTLDGNFDLDSIASITINPITDANSINWYSEFKAKNLTEYSEEDKNHLISVMQMGQLRLKLI